MANTKSLGANVLASVLIVAGWGYFLIQGVRDPDGGVKALWPLFGIANQLLASIALCLGTTVILKMQLTAPAESSNSRSSTAPTHRGPREDSAGGQPVLRGRPAFALITLVPLLWLLTVTMTAGLETIFHPRIGFLQKAADLDAKLNGLNLALSSAQAGGNQAAIEAAQKSLRNNRILHFNNRVDAVVVSVFLVLVAATFLISVREWILLLARRRMVHLRETPPAWLPDYAVAEGQPLRIFGLLALALGLARELSGEAHLERAQQLVSLCPLHEKEHSQAEGIAGREVVAGEQQDPRRPKMPGQVYNETVERRFKGINRCC